MNDDAIRVFTVLYSDKYEPSGFSVAVFDTPTDARRFAVELVADAIADELDSHGYDATSELPAYRDSVTLENWQDALDVLQYETWNGSIDDFRVEIESTPVRGGRS